MPNLDITGNPPAVAGHSVWSARYTGTITAPATGDYRFSLSGGGYVASGSTARRSSSFTPFHEPYSTG